MLVHIAHANGIPGATYQPIIQRLQPHQGIAIPRFGHDPRFPVTHNWQALADELITYLEANAAEPVVGVGHSMGSIVTFIAACKRPDLFRGVLMLDPSLFWGAMALTCKLLKLLGRMDDVAPSGKSKFRKRNWPDRQTAVAYFASKRLFQFHPDCFESFCQSAIEDCANGEVKLHFDVDVECDIFRNTPDNLRKYKRPPNLPMRLVYADKSDASMEKMVLPFCRHFAIPVEKIAGEHMYPLQQPDLTAELIHRFIQECK
ncbi:MAG: alpha/beta hydrolase [Gammaproteobacteria bacterium]